MSRTAGYGIFVLFTLSGGCRPTADAAFGTGAREERVRHAPAEKVVTAPLVLDLPAVAARARRSVVSVIAGRAAERASTPEHAARPAREHALGSGFLIEPDGLVLTSRHVIDGADDVRVDLDDGRSFRGAVVARDAALDVALVRLEGARGLPVSELGSSGTLRVGDPVVAIGNPFGLGPSVTVGILSATSRGVEDGPAGEFLQTDAAVNPGDSGGPLVDAGGRVIGINTAIVEHGQGISFAIPIDDVRAVLRELETTGRVARGHAGLSFQAVDPPLARALGLASPSGALITEIAAPGPAQRAGVRVGDLITATDGRPVTRAEDVARELARKKPGDVLRLDLRRGASSWTASLVLERLPNHDADAESPAARASRPHGISGLRLADAEGGARVESLDPASVAADGLRIGDVVVEIDRTPVHGAAEATLRLTRAARSALAPAALHGVLTVSAGAHHASLLRIRRGGSFLYLGLDLD